MRYNEADQLYGKRETAQQGQSQILCKLQNMV